MRQHVRVERLVRDVLAPEPLAVDLVDLVEFQARLRLEGGERSHCLGRKRAAVHEEEDSPRHARLHEPVGLVDHRECLARTGRHRDQHAALASGDGLLDASVRLDLVGTKTLMVIGEPLKALAGAFQVAIQELTESFGSVKASHPA